MPMPFANDRRGNRIVIGLAIVAAVAIVVTGIVAIAVLTAVTYRELFS